MFVFNLYSHTFIIMLLCQLIIYLLYRKREEGEGEEEERQRE